MREQTLATSKTNKKRSRWVCDALGSLHCLVWLTWKKQEENDQRCEKVWDGCIQEVWERWRWSPRAMWLGYDSSWDSNPRTRFRGLLCCKAGEAPHRGLNNFGSSRSLVDWLEKHRQQLLGFEVVGLVPHFLGEKSLNYEAINTKNINLNPPRSPKSTNYYNIPNVHCNNIHNLVGLLWSLQCSLLNLESVGRWLTFPQPSSSYGVIILDNFDVHYVFIDSINHMAIL